MISPGWRWPAPSSTERLSTRRATTCRATSPRMESFFTRGKKKQIQNQNKITGADLPPPEAGRPGGSAIYQMIIIPCGLLHYFIIYLGPQDLTGDNAELCGIFSAERVRENRGISCSYQICRELSLSIGVIVVLIYSVFRRMSAAGRQSEYRSVVENIARSVQTASASPPFLSA